MIGDQFIDVAGPVHYVDHGGEGPVMVMAHGLAGSHLNWTFVAPRLSERFRVLAPDLAGFGLTPPSGRKATVRANRDLLHAFAERMSPDEPVVLVGNSMGGLIALMEAAEHPDRVAAAVLVNPALPVVDAGAVNVFTLQRLFFPLLPVVGGLGMRRYFSSTPAEKQLDQTLAVVCADPATFPPEGRPASIAMLERRRTMPWRTTAYLQASRSIGLELAKLPQFWRKVGAVECPVLLIHGTEDRIVSPGSARWLAAKRPDWEFRLLEGVGHVPQIEAPDLFVDLVEGFLA